jgi:hypothetical protein
MRKPCRGIWESTGVQTQFWQCSNCYMWFTTLQDHDEPTLWERIKRAIRYRDRRYIAGVKVSGR